MYNTTKQQPPPLPPLRPRSAQPIGLPVYDPPAAVEELPDDIIPGMRPLPPRHARHAVSRQAQRRLRLAFIAACVLIPLVTIAVMIMTHTPFFRASTTARHTPAVTHTSLTDVPGVPASFAACVAARESGDGIMSGNIYGIPANSGFNVASAPLAQQKVAFAMLYQKFGTTPWAPCK
jgi:hypothetical protein